MIAIAAVIVSALTMIIVALQVAEARKANALPGTIDLFREYRSAEMEKARWLLTERLPDLDPAIGMRGLPDDVAAAAFQVGQYLDNLGVLVARGLLAPELAAGFLGDSALRMWRVLLRSSCASVNCGRRRIISITSSTSQRRCSRSTQPAPAPSCAPSPARRQR